MKRLTIFIFGLLFLGLVTSVAVAWLLPRVTDSQFVFLPHGVPSFGTLELRSSPPVHERYLQAGVRRFAAVEGDRKPGDIRLAGRALPLWSPLRRPDRYRDVLIIEDCYGWPFVCVGCYWVGIPPQYGDERAALRAGQWNRAASESPWGYRWEALNPGDLRVSGGWQGKPKAGALHLQGTPYIGELNAIPLLPLWSGLALNTVFYALIWAAFWFALPSDLWLRRWFWRRKRLCASCAYDLRATKEPRCPECGEALNARLPLFSGFRLIAPIVAATCLSAGLAAWAAWFLSINVSPIPPLHAAIRNGDLSEIERLTLSGADLNEEWTATAGGKIVAYAPVHFAIRYGRHEALELLLGRGARPDPSGTGATSPIGLAAGMSDETSLAMLLKAGATIKPVQLAAILLQDSVLKNPRLLAALLDLRSPDPGPDSLLAPLLVRAAELNLTETANLLIERGVDPNSSMDDGTTALFLAAGHGNVPLMESLIAAGANPQGGRLSALVAATIHCQVEAVRFLLAHGADPRPEANRGYCLLGNASACETPELAEIMLSLGYKIEDKNLRDNGVLHYWAYGAQSRDTLAFLLERGADINMTDDWGGTALIIVASSARNDKRVRWLLEAGADPTIRDRSGKIAADYSDGVSKRLLEAAIKEWEAKKKGESDQ